MWDTSIYIFFSLPSFIFQNLHTNSHKHLNTNPHVDTHECTSHFGMWRNFVFVASPLVLRNGVRRTHCGGAWAFPWRSPFAGVRKEGPLPFVFNIPSFIIFKAFGEISWIINLPADLKNLPTECSNSLTRHPCSSDDKCDWCWLLPPLCQHEVSISVFLCDKHTNRFKWGLFSIFVNLKPNHI